jgi:two-component system LytT family response regulator
MKRPLRVMVVDDEKPARARLVVLLERQAGIELAGSVDSAEAALAVVSRAAGSEAPVDIIFLDVQMPDMDGFAMLDSLYATPASPKPVVVFATAYDAYALRAFDAHAIDYLLKPYRDERFEIALARAVRLVRTGDEGSLADQIQVLLRSLAPPPRQNYLDKLALKERGRVRLISVSDIRWIAAAGVYITIHTAREKYLQREVLGRLEAQLDPRSFVRIHRSHIVNFDFVQELKQDAHGEFEAILKDAPPLRVSRMYRSRIEEGGSISGCSRHSQHAARRSRQYTAIRHKSFGRATRTSYTGNVAVTIGSAQTGKYPLESANERPGPNYT